MSTAKASEERMPEPKSNCGVYMLLCKTTEQSYIGASTCLEQRLRTHAANIRNRSGNDRYLAGFPCVDDVEFRVLEYCDFTEITAHGDDEEDEYIKQYDVQQKQVHALQDREHHWIVMLRPTLNVRKRHRQIKLADLPVGPPEE